MGLRSYLSAGLGLAGTTAGRRCPGSPRRLPPGSTRLPHPANAAQAPGARPTPPRTLLRWIRAPASPGPVGDASLAPRGGNELVALPAGGTQMLAIFQGVARLVVGRVPPSCCSRGHLLCEDSPGNGRRLWGISGDWWGPLMMQCLVLRAQACQVHRGSFRGSVGRGRCRSGRTRRGRGLGRDRKSVV